MSRLSAAPTGTRTPANSQSPPSSGWSPLTLSPLLLLLFLCGAALAPRSSRRTARTPSAWTACAVTFEEWEPGGPKPFYKRGRRKALRLHRYNQKWKGAVQSAVRDSSYAMDLFAREGGFVRYVQLRKALGRLFVFAYLKARPRGTYPPDPRIKRRSFVGRLFSNCFYLIDENGRPFAPSEGDLDPEWKEPIELRGVRYGVERNKLKKGLKRFRVQTTKRMVLRRLHPPLPQYRKWLAESKSTLRRIMVAMETFLADDSKENWRLIGDTLKDVHDVVETARPAGLYVTSLVHRTNEDGIPFRVHELPFCSWCNHPRKPLDPQNVDASTDGSSATTEEDWGDEEEILYPDPGSHRRTHNATSY